MRCPLSIRTHHLGRAAVSGLAIVALTMVSLVGITTSAGATQEVCPHTSGWIKVDLSQDGIVTVPIEAPAGMAIVETCVKAATDIVYLTVDPGLPSVLLATPAVNAQGNPQAISHYAYRLATVAEVPPSDQPPSDQPPSDQPPTDDEPLVVTPIAATPAAITATAVTPTVTPAVVTPPATSTPATSTARDTSHLSLAETGIDLRPLTLALVLILAGCCLVLGARKATHRA